MTGAIRQVIEALINGGDSREYFASLGITCPAATMDEGRPAEIGRRALLVYSSKLEPIAGVIGVSVLQQRI